MSLEVKVPELGESISQASVADIKIKVNELVKQDQLLFEIETDKVTLEVIAPSDGKVEEILVKQDDIVKTASVLCKLKALTNTEIKELENKNTQVVEQKKVQQENNTKTTNTTEILKTQEHASKNSTIKEGVKLKIFKDTVEVFLDKQLNKVAGVSSRASNPDRDAQEGETKVAMSSIRKKIASNLKFSQESSVSLTTFNDANLSNLLRLRSNLNKSNTLSVKLGITSFFVKAASEAVKNYAVMNSEIAGESIIYKNYHDFGVAVGTNYGLVVPNIRNCQEKTILQIEKDLANFVEKANKRQLNIEDIKKGSFTISNGGVYGSLLSTPIINPPQVAILGLHAIKKRPIVNDENNIVVADIMNLALTYDHRIIDGKEAVSFLRNIKELIEAPEQLLFKGLENE